MAANQNPATGANGTSSHGTGTNGNQETPSATNDRQKKKPKTNSSKGNEFKGNMEDMSGHVFQTCGEAIDRMQFNKTLEALGHYCKSRNN